MTTRTLHRPERREKAMGGEKQAANMTAQPLKIKGDLEFFQSGKSLTHLPLSPQ